MTLSTSYNSALREIGSLSWERIFNQWRYAEMWQEGWRALWKEEGFNSWDAWRNDYIAPLAPKEKKWTLYHIDDISVIKDFYGVPTRIWVRECYGGETTLPLHTVVQTPFVKNDQKIAMLRKSFPTTIMITGVINEKRIVLVDGMHRSCALTQCILDKSVPTTSVCIALAPHDDVLPILK